MAQFTVEKSAEVNAAADEIWSALVDVKSWPSWKPFMSKASISGYETLTCGAKLKMSIQIGGPAAIPLSAKVVEFRRPEKLAWEGGSPKLFHALHSFELIPKGDNKTLVISRETFSGALLPLVLRIVTKEDLEKLHEQWVQAIKDKMEPKPKTEQDPGHSH